MQPVFFGNRVKVSAAYKSYPAASSDAWKGSLHNSFSGKYLIVNSWFIFLSFCIYRKKCYLITVILIIN